MEINGTQIILEQCEYDALIAENVALKARVKELEELVKQLQVQINTLLTKKNSSNSSIPPSTDLTRKNRSLRTLSGKKPGGQSGHEGHTLIMTDTPDETHKLIPDYCNQCGNELAEIEAQFESKRQVVEMPPIKPLYIEFQSYSKICTCGHKQIGNYPCGVTNHIQYGASIEAIIGYQSVYQYTPFKRLRELFNHCFHLPISEGSIDNILKRLSAKALPLYQAIKGQIEMSEQVGGDETGVKINGKKGWLFTFQTSALTFLSVSLSRGFDTIQSLFKNGFPFSVYVTDCLVAQLKTVAKAHQLCTSHLLRELNNFIDALGCQWSMEMKQLLQQAIELKPQLTCDDYLH